MVLRRLPTLLLMIVLPTLGACGAFSYVSEETPPYEIDDVIDFYEEGGFDLGVAMDHLILAFDIDADDALFPAEVIAPEWVERQQLVMVEREIRLVYRRSQIPGIVPVREAQPDSAFAGHGNPHALVKGRKV